MTTDVNIKTPKYPDSPSRRFTFLGTGTSQGVPVIGCRCEVCTSDDPRDNRLRCSALITIDYQDIVTNIVIDTGPDFRQQMLRAHVTDIDAVLYTHEHSDHTAGLDDVRPFNFRQRHPMPLYATPAVQTALRTRFDYAFAENPYPGAPQLDLITINKNDSIRINNSDVQPIGIMHGALPILGFRIGDLTYITDCKSIEPEEMAKIEGTKILILDALHHNEHHAHLNLTQALDIVNHVKPERAYFIHCSHHMGKAADVNPTLPDGVELAYDGLSFEF